ncbi:MAG: HAD hydrolase-like protein [Pseudomonadota bacterium]
MAQPYILDLDGTLMPSHAVDNECYWAAVAETFDVAQDTVALTNFTNVSDDGILNEWAERTLGRGVTPVEHATMKQVFLRCIDDAARTNLAAFRPFPGVIEWLAARPAGSIAIATGGWSHTARRKLSLASLSAFELPLASSDDDHRREMIMRHAHTLLAPEFRGTTPIYLGDGPWDFSASADLGWGFIGIAEGERASRLQALGAEEVHADFLPLLP